ncbi:MAG TPA: nucleoside 2-deoxyribosyltransferase [Candidatus Bathyarchaeia archaeon]|nr:nucleoside 2-deoxyribosyltransferase [Candidatus Bathyarchaeia archaeon]
MKIYFTASVHGQEKFLENYEKIIDCLEKMGHSLVSKRPLDVQLDKVESENDEEKISFYKKVLDWINKSDIVVAEISYPSINVGHEISLALEKGKPVIVLYTGKNEPHLLQGLISEKIAILNYNIDNLNDILRGGLEEAKNQMDVRFNFFISPKIGAYLDWIAKHKKLPRAVFLRRLIEEHMSKNKDYNKA